MATVLQALNAALHQALAQDDRVIVLGEDLLDPYGGAFKVTRGLSEAFPGRVLTTPISEAGFSGAAAGMAMRGLRPVVEIMFGDFLTLAADQLVNHAARFGWMYGGNKTEAERPQVPMVIRTPMGGRRGYGPTHSGTIEKHFLGVPGLHVLAASAIGDPGGLLLEAILHTQDPVLFIENKLLYLVPLRPADGDAEIEIQTEIGPTIGTGRVRPPTYTLRVRGAPPPNLTLAAYGYMSEMACEALLRLAYEHEVFAELVVPACLAPIRLKEVIESARQTGRLAAIEEGTLDFGWGSEVVARCAEALGPGLIRAGRVAAANLPVPASGPLENAVLPSVEQIIKTSLELIQNR